MALKITEWETRYEVANKLSNIDVEFISLVPQGRMANRSRWSKVRTKPPKMAAKGIV